MTALEDNARPIFLTAVERAADQWPAFLDEACGDNAELRARVEQLLQAHQLMGSIHGSSAPTIAYRVSEGPGTVIGPYKLLQLIGEGGFGVVFLAEQQEPVRRKVAFKILKPGMDSKQVVARFEAERQALAIMDHPNIAKVFDGGTTPAGRPYFVMELVKGVPITEYCDLHQLTPRQRLELFLPVCQAVQHAHQKGIIHRDLKPSNVLVTRHDTTPMIKVIDFGVAKALGQELTDKTLFTGIAQMIGTPLYMSPEQAGMSDLDIDTRSDIYSLGVLLYELLTGTTPFTKERFKKAAYDEIRRIIREEDPPKPSTRLSEAKSSLTSISAQRHIEPAKLTRFVRGELDWIVMKCLEKDRNRRYETSSGFAADLQRYLNDEPVAACPPSLRYQLWKFARRNKSILVSASLLVGTLIVGTMVSSWQALRAIQAESLAQTRLKAETEAQEKAMLRLYESRLAQAKAGSLSRRPGQRLDSLDALVEAVRIARDLKFSNAHLLQLRNAAIACLALSDMRLAKQWPGWPSSSQHVDFDDKLEKYVRVDWTGTASIRRVQEDTEIASLPGSGTESWPLMSRDGKFLSIRSNVIRLWNLSGPTPVAIENLPAGEFEWIEFSPDSRLCVISRTDGSFRLYDLTSGQPPRELPKGRHGRRFAIHPDGQTFAVMCDDAVEIRDLNTGKKLTDLHPPARTAGGLAWHPNGKTLAVVCYDYRVYLWDVPTGTQTVILEGFKNLGTEVAFNHRGNMIATTGWEGMLRLWDARTGRQVFSTMSGVIGTPPRFSQDDGWVSADARDGKLGLWEIASANEYKTLIHSQTTGEMSYHSLGIHSDQSLLAVGMLGGFGLWDMANGKELAHVKLAGQNLVVFEPSGTLLTNGTDGLLRWPISTKSHPPQNERNEIERATTVGPPSVLPLPGSTYYLACSRNGKVIGSPQGRGGLVLHTDQMSAPVRVAPNLDTRRIALSPDGQLAATSSHLIPGVRIWDTHSGALIKELPAGYLVDFSPDGKWLATAGAGLRLWTIGTWLEGPRISEGYAFAFSPDGQMLAVETNYGIVRLLAPDTFEEFARLEDPHQDRCNGLQFSSDGTQLVTVNNDSQSIHIWDLRSIRAQLRSLGLDWNQPPYLSVDLRQSHSQRVEVNLGDLVTTLQTQALDTYSKALAREPSNAQYQNELAWLLATCPVEKLRDPTRAVDAAKKAVKLAPKTGTYWNTLGVCHYRKADWRDSLAALEKSMELRLGGDSFDWFFMAMAYWQLGDHREARSWYERALLWMQKNQPQDEELLRFNAEATKLLDVKK